LAVVQIALIVCVIQKSVLYFACYEEIFQKGLGVNAQTVQVDCSELQRLAHFSYIRNSLRRVE
jgi:hypothetical protein